MSERADDDDQPRFADVVHTQNELTELFEEKHLTGVTPGLCRCSSSDVRHFNPAFAITCLPTRGRPANAHATERLSAQFVIDTLHDIDQLLQQLNDFMRSPAFVAVVCSPHDEATADTESVFQAAMRLMDYYERFLVLAERARGLAAPSDYSDLLNNCARLPDTSLDGFRNFIDRFVESAAVSEATLIPDVHLAGRRGCARSGSGSAGG